MTGGASVLPGWEVFSVIENAPGWGDPGASDQDWPVPGPVMLRPGESMPVNQNTKTPGEDPLVGTKSLPPQSPVRGPVVLEHTVCRVPAKPCTAT